MNDPFGLRSLTVEQARARPGAKWQFHPAEYSVWVADMDFPIAPVVRDRLIEVAQTDVGYPNWGGKRSVSPAVIAFVDRMTSRYGWPAQPARLYEMSDVVQGVRIAVHHLTKPGDGIVLHTPAYHPFLETIDSMQRRIVRVPAPFDHDALDAALAREPARLMILCHPHNPTGHVFTRSELERIAEVAARYDLIVVSDEIHADLVHAPHGHVPFDSLGPEVAARTITVTSASKAFNLAGLRWAIMHAGSDVMRSALDALPAHYLGAPNVMAVEATATAWTAGDPWLESVREVLDENRHALSVSSPRTSRTFGTRLRTRRISRGSTAGRSGSATTPRRRSANGASSSAPVRSSASRARGSCVSTSRRARRSSPRPSPRCPATTETPPFCLLQIALGLV